MNSVLFVKKGALGDVVRTSYFAGALKRKYNGNIQVDWLTSPSALPLLKYNPHIDHLSHDDRDFLGHSYDRIFSLDDERDILCQVASFQCKRLVGAFLNDSGNASYTDDSGEWFDMGLLSKLGKPNADALKKANTRTHSEIFSAILGVEEVRPEFFGGEECAAAAAKVSSCGQMLIGINPYAGGRWKSKELPEPELTELVRRILDAATPIASIRILLLGAGRDYERNKEVEKRFCDERLCAINTDESVLHLAGAIGALELLITSDSLALHLGIAQRVPCSAFFAPTSGAEIDSFGLVAKVLSTSADYCCYRSHADNSSVTATRILSAASGLRSCVESDELNRLLAAWS